MNLPMRLATTRPSFTRMRLVTNAKLLDTRALASEFPTVKVARTYAAQVNDAMISADEWRSLISFKLFDDALTRTAADTIVVRGERHIENVACEILTRYQRFIPRRNGSSRTPMFSTVLQARRALHDQRKPIASLRFDRALDTWQWMLRIDPSASLTAQLAALFHDIWTERATISRATDRPPHQPALEAVRPLGGGTFTFDVLCEAGVPRTIAARVRQILSANARRGCDQEMDLLDDAGALSFLSLDSSGYLDRFGPEETARKIARILGRLGAEARAKLQLVRLRPDVRFLTQAAA